MRPLKDNEFLEALLSDGRWHSRDEIIESSQQLRGYGLTVHSRAADLRKRGHVVETRLERDRRGRTLSYYRLVTLDEAAVSVAALGGVAPDSATAASSSVPATNGADQGSVFPPHVEPAGTLALFECVVDESAGLRGAYWGDAA